MPWRAGTEENSTNPSPNNRRTTFIVSGDPGTERREIIAERLRLRRRGQGQSWNSGSTAVRRTQWLGQCVINCSVNFVIMIGPGLSRNAGKARVPCCGGADHPKSPPAAATYAAEMSLQSSGKSLDKLLPIRVGIVLEVDIYVST